MARAEQPQPRQSVISRLTAEQATVREEIGTHQGAIARTDIQATEVTAALTSRRDFHQGQVELHTAAVARHAGQVAEVTAQIAEASAPFAAERDQEEAKMRPVVDRDIVVGAELAKYDKAHKRIAALGLPQTTEEQRTDTVEYFVSDAGAHTLEDLREFHGPDYAGPETFRHNRTPEEIADEKISPDAPGDIEKRRLRIRARTGDPASMVEYYVGTETREKVGRRFALYGHDIDAWGERIDQQIKGMVAADARNDAKSPLLPTLYPEYYPKAPATKTIYEK